MFQKIFLVTTDTFIGEYYDHERLHSSLTDQTPNEVYQGIKPLSLAA